MSAPERVWIRWTMGEVLVAYTAHALGTEYVRSDLIAPGPEVGEREFVASCVAGYIRWTYNNEDPEWTTPDWPEIVGKSFAESHDGMTLSARLREQGSVEQDGGSRPGVASASAGPIASSLRARGAERRKKDHGVEWRSRSSDINDQRRREGCLYPWQHAEGCNCYERRTDYNSAHRIALTGPSMAGGADRRSPVQEGPK